MADTLITGTTLIEKESRSIGDAPIGAILAWAKTLTGVPNLAEGWVECDGTVLVDALSPLNGQTIPNLNGDNRFLRGESTSGGTGGSETSSHNHQSPVTTDGGNICIDEDFSSTGDKTENKRVTTSTVTTTNSTNYLTSTTAPTNLPPYYNIVWIMRVR